jgi:hypothetical protein
VFSVPFWLPEGMLDEENIRLANGSILFDTPLHKLAVLGLGKLGVASEDYLRHLVKQILTNLGPWLRE